VLDLRATGPDVPDHLLTCMPEPAPPARPAPGKPRDPKASAHWTLDLADAGRDCRTKLGKVRGILKPEGAERARGRVDRRGGRAVPSYATPLFKGWLGLADADAATANAVAFGIGLVCLSLAKGIITIANAWALRPKLPPAMGAAAVINAAVDEADERAKK